MSSQDHTQDGFSVEKPTYLKIIGYKTIQMSLISQLTINPWFPQSTPFKYDEATFCQMANYFSKTRQKSPCR